MFTENKNVYWNKKIMEQKVTGIKNAGKLPASLIQIY